jgi:hypothetical protein
MIRTLKLVVLSLVSLLALLAAPNPASASGCARLRIPSVGIDRCVVTGNQRAINAGHVVRVAQLSGASRDWIAAHRTSHGGPFRRLTGLQVGDIVQWEQQDYRVVQRAVVDRRRPGAVLGWGPLVLQTSRGGGLVYVWRLTAA